MSNDIVLEIGDFLGFCDLNGLDAIQDEQVQKLEEYISLANDAYYNSDELLIPNALWDRLMEILRKVKPESELCKYIWEDTVDELDNTDAIFENNPMYSIMTVKSYDCDEINNFVKRLPDDVNFDAHVSVKLNGHGIRLKYKNGDFIQARSRARSSAGRDITKQLRVCLERDELHILPDLDSLDLCEIRGEWVLPFSNLNRAKEFNPEIKSAFSGVASMGRDSASEEEWGLLHFVAYEFLADGVTFNSKSEEYSYLEELGFEVPLSWEIEDLNKDSLIDELKENIVPECEDQVMPDENDENGYDYYTDGLVFSVNNTEFFRTLGDDGTHYKYGNMALKVGYWEQNVLSGYVQAILWTKGKSKFSPVAILGSEKDMIVFKDETYDETFFYNKNEVENWDDLGVVSMSGNKIRRIPLYEPANLAILDAYPGNILHFRYGGEAGVIPCFEDGTPLLEGRVQRVLANEDKFIYDEDDFYYEG